ncbi:MAG: DNA polymerase IV [Alphaproteobacteria bacterium]|nr:DNA polymerase IV [Alphaproteobacteria bacterium]
MDAMLCRQCCRLTPGARACPRCGGQRVVRHRELTGLSIAHVDCDAFYASVEKRDDPTLEDRPLIIGHAGGRGVVTTACYLARQSGARSAMPMFKALELCPDAVVMPPDMAKYKDVSNQIRALFLEATDSFEPVSLDEAYLDLTPGHIADDILSPAQLLARLANDVRDKVGVTVSIGLSYNKFLAKLASDLDKPDGFSVIGRHEAEEFLAPLAITKINGVGAQTARRLERAGIMTIADLRARPEEELVALVGRFGRRLSGYARGVDDREIAASRLSKSISAETTFRADISDAGALADVAAQLCGRVAVQLERKGLSAATVVLKLKTHDFKVITRNRQLAHPTQRADTLLEQARLLIEAAADGRLFRLIGVGVSDLRTAAEADPPDLFSM